MAMILQQVLARAGYSVYSYSGRGMYGKHCIAVSFPGEVGDLVADVLSALADEGADGEDLAAVAEELRCLRTDSMGRDSVAYFPDVAPDLGVAPFAEGVAPEAGEAP